MISLSCHHGAVRIALRFPDGRTWDGASAFGYVREARIIGQLADVG